MAVLWSARTKLEHGLMRAQHLTMLQDAFFSSGGFRLERIQSDDGRWLVWVARLTDPPLGISLLAAEAFNAFRSALDHAVWALVDRAGGSPGDHTAFPIRDVSKSWTKVAMGPIGSRRPGPLCGLGTDLVDVISRHQPFDPSSNGRLGLLRDFDNDSKHRVLVPRVLQVAWASPQHAPAAMSTMIRHNLAKFEQVDVVADGQEIVRVVDPKGGSALQWGHPRDWTMDAYGELVLPGRAAVLRTGEIKTLGQAVASVLDELEAAAV